MSSTVPSTSTKYESHTVLAISKTADGVGGLALTKHDVPEPGPGEFRLKVAAAGICGTDMQIYHWAPRMARRMALPRIMGHEVSGVVEAVGTGVTRVALGDHVSLESHIYCGQCAPCKQDRAHLCEATRYPGIDIDGAFASHLVVPEVIAWKNSKDLPHEDAAMLEPFGIAVHACLEGSGVDSQSVLINGCGPIGLMAVAAARALGAANIIAADPNPLRRDQATKIGADDAFDPASVDLVSAVNDVTRNAGVDVAIEFSGQPDGFRASIEAVAKGGDFRLVGAPAHPLEIDLTRWLLRCPRIINIHGRRIWESWEAAVPLIESGAVDLAPIRSHVLPLSEGLQGFDLILKGDALKPILIPD